MREPRRSAQMPASGEAISMPIASGASLMPAVIGSSPCDALEVEDEDEDQGEAGEAVDEGGAGGGGEQAVLGRSSGRASARWPRLSIRTNSGSSTTAAARPAITIGSVQPERPPLEMP